MPGRYVQAGPACGRRVAASTRVRSTRFPFKPFGVLLVQVQARLPASLGGTAVLVQVRLLASLGWKEGEAGLCRC